MRRWLLPASGARRAAGKDTRGIFRVHEFDKVEMFAFVELQDAVAEHVPSALRSKRGDRQGLGYPVSAW